MSPSEYSGTLLMATPEYRPPLYNGQAPRSQMNSLCTKQPLNKGHPYITANILFPKGGRYRGVPLYTAVLSTFLQHTQMGKPQCKHGLLYLSGFFTKFAVIYN